jgi:hypothetical protein
MRTSGQTLVAAQSGPRTVECANCAGRFPVVGRPAAFCSPACGAEAAAVRFARRQRAAFGDDLPRPARARLHRMVVHAVLECGPEQWPQGLVRAVPGVEVDDSIPEQDLFARKVGRLRARVLAGQALRPCDVPDWDATWRGWVRRQAC